MRQFLFTLITLISFISNGYADDDKRYLQHQLFGHYKSGMEHYEIVKQNCYEIKNINKRKKAFYCLKLSEILIPGCMKALRTKKIEELFIEEQLDKIVEWEEIYKHLYQADHHFEMMDIYQELLK